MHIEDTIRINAPAARIYELGAYIEEWPRLLPHYRWVTVLREEGQHRLVEMAATRNGIPISWVSLQDCDPVRQTIRYRHVRGATRGMIVEWTLTPTATGVEVCISHDFDPPWPRPLGPLIAHYVVCDFFVHNIAEKTLRRIKTLAEADPAAVDTPPSTTVSARGGQR